MKVVVNRCFGGFGLSEEAYERLIELGVPVKKYVKQKRDPKTNLYKPSKDEGKFVIYDRSLDDEDKDGMSSLMMKMTGRYWDAFIRGNNRDNPLLVQVVEELGKRANGKHAELEVVEIPDGIEWEIDEYDGSETIDEKHRSW